MHTYIDASLDRTHCLHPSIPYSTMACVLAYHDPSWPVIQPAMALPWHWHGLVMACHRMPSHVIARHARQYLAIACSPNLVLLRRPRCDLLTDRPLHYNQHNNAKGGLRARKDRSSRYTRYIQTYALICVVVHIGRLSHSRTHAACTIPPFRKCLRMTGNPPDGGRSASRARTGNFKREYMH